MVSDGVMHRDGHGRIEEKNIAIRDGFALPSLLQYFVKNIEHMFDCQQKRLYNIYRTNVLNAEGICLTVKD